MFTVLGRESKENWRKRKKHYYGVERAKSFDPDRWRGEMNKDLLFKLMSDSNCVSAMKFFNYINHEWGNALYQSKLTKNTTTTVSEKLRFSTICSSKCIGSEYNKLPCLYKRFLMQVTPDLKYYLLGVQKSWISLHTPLQNWLKYNNIFFQKCIFYMI